LTSHAIAPPLPERRNCFALFLGRLWGLALRHVYLYMGSWPRFVELLYWPLISILTYGFISLYFVRKFSDSTVTIEAFVAGVLLAEIMSRTTAGMLLLFMEEIWSRNLGHLFASPIRLYEYTLSVLFMGALRSLLAVLLASIVAYFLFGVSLSHLGWPLALYILLLFINSWWFGLLILALVMRYGLAAEWLGWMLAFSFLPFVAPYYPVSIMPPALQIISWCLPATYVFESMKSLVARHELQGGMLLIALGLNLIYFTAAAFIFRRAYQGARRRGTLLQTGE
jgi:ABC-2 type transport system permease protein